MKHKSIKELQHQSTWCLLGLAIITFGVYFAHYIKRQTEIINSNIDDKISDGFIGFILITTYLSLALFIAYFFMEENHPIVWIGNAMDAINNVAYIVWGFKARNRMNIIISAEKKSLEWFHGLWTFLFTPLYFNYKVNVLFAQAEQDDESTGSQSPQN